MSEERTPLPTEHGELLDELRRTTVAARALGRNFNLVAERALSAERRVEELERELELSLRESERLRLLIRDHIYGDG